MVQMLIKKNARFYSSYVETTMRIFVGPEYHIDIALAKFLLLSYYRYLHFSSIKKPCQISFHINKLSYQHITFLLKTSFTHVKKAC